MVSVIVCDMAENLRQESDGSAEKRWKIGAIAQCLVIKKTL